MIMRALEKIRNSYDYELMLRGVVHFPSHIIVFLAVFIFLHTMILAVVIYVIEEKIENFKEEKIMKNMKKIFLGLIFFTLTAVSLAQSETEYHLERIGNQLMYSRIPHNDCYVSSVIAKRPY